MTLRKITNMIDEKLNKPARHSLMKKSIKKLPKNAWNRQDSDNQNNMDCQEVQMGDPKI